jgi:hypothetical protein
MMNPKKHAVTVKEVLEVFKNCLELSEKDIAFCFGMSKMSVVNELTSAKAYDKMMFVEFLEFIGRIAYTKYRAPGDPISEYQLY